MHHARDRASRRSWRSILLGAVSLTALLLCLSAGTATACTSGGPSCLPGSGYTFDDIWNCGTIATPTRCYHASTTNVLTATSDTWGWGSASYNGSGDLWICVQGGSQFVGCGTNLARACALETCNAQSAVWMYLWVENTSRTAHTVHGHDKS